MRIPKRLFKEPKMCSTTFLADAWHKLNNSSWLAGLYYNNIRLELKKNSIQSGLLYRCSSPLCKMIANTLVRNKQGVTCTKTSISKKMFPIRDGKVT